MYNDNPATHTIEKSRRHLDSYSSLVKETDRSDASYLVKRSEKYSARPGALKWRGRRGRVTCRSCDIRCLRRVLTFRRANVADWSLFRRQASRQSCLVEQMMFLEGTESKGVRIYTQQTSWQLKFTRLYASIHVRHICQTDIDNKLLFGMWISVGKDKYNERRA